MKFFVIALLVIAAGYYWLRANPDKVMDTALSQGNMTLAQMLEGSTEKLASKCSDPSVQSRLDMSQSACEQMIRERNPVCYERITKKWPQVIDNQKDLHAAMDDYAACLWSGVGS